MTYRSATCAQQYFAEKKPDTIYVLHGINSDSDSPTEEVHIPHPLPCNHSILLLMPLDC
jgi:hypothetical protein